MEIYKASHHRYTSVTIFIVNHFKSLFNRMLIVTPHALLASTKKSLNESRSVFPPPCFVGLLLLSNVLSAVPPAVYSQFFLFSTSCTFSHVSLSHNCLVCTSIFHNDATWMFLSSFYRYSSPILNTLILT